MIVQFGDSKQHSLIYRFAGLFVFFVLCAVFAPFGPSSFPFTEPDAPVLSPFSPDPALFSGIRMNSVSLRADFALNGSEPSFRFSLPQSENRVLLSLEGAGFPLPERLLMLDEEGLHQFSSETNSFVPASAPDSRYLLTLPPVQLDVKPILQDDVFLPNGCESVSMSMLMRYYGISVDPYEFTMNYVPKKEILRYGEGKFAPDPEQAYIGDPSSPFEGWYCFEGPVINGTNDYLKKAAPAFYAKKISGADYAQLWHALYTGHPVAVWLTVDYMPPRLNPKMVFTLPSGRRYRPYRNLHCLVLTGMDHDRFYLSDPKRGQISIPRDQFFSLYNAMGQRAVILDSVYEHK